MQRSLGQDETAKGDVLTDIKLTAFFNEVDANGNGKIDKNEFKAAMTKISTRIERMEGGASTQLLDSQLARSQSIGNEEEEEEGMGPPQDLLLWMAARLGSSALIVCSAYGGIIAAWGAHRRVLAARRRALCAA